MRIIRSQTKMSALSDGLKKKGMSIGLVPTMGYLHEGHLSLIRKARKENDSVVVSIFVNPAQFGPKEDLRKYPRDLGRDSDLCRKIGTDIIFYPTIKSMYPDMYVTYVDVEDITRLLCGKSRPGHFRGVATVVAKLFNIIRPDTAYFGQKDFQQAQVIKKMVKDLNMNVKVSVLATVREKDGLAMSSRNKYLKGVDRQDASVLYGALMNARALIKEGERDPGKVIKAIITLISKKASAKIDYVEIVDPETLQRVEKIRNRVLIALAVFINKTRLIDNLLIRI